MTRMARIDARGHTGGVRRQGSGGRGQLGLKLELQATVDSPRTHPSQPAGTRQTSFWRRNWVAALLFASLLPLTSWSAVVTPCRGDRPLTPPYSVLSFSVAEL